MAKTVLAEADDRNNENLSPERLQRPHRDSTRLNLIYNRSFMKNKTSIEHKEAAVATTAKRALNK